MNTPAIDVKDVLVAAGYTFAGIGDWGVHVSNEPAESPNRCVTIYDASAGTATPYVDPNLAPTEYPTVQVRVRGMSYTEASVKAQEIATLLGKKGQFTAGGAQYGGLFQQGSVNFLKSDAHGRFYFVMNFSTVREKV